MTKDKRITRPVRVEKNWLKRLRIEAASSELSVPKLLEEVFEDYFGSSNKKNQNNEK